MTMFRLLRAAPRVLPLSTSPAISAVAKPRTITTFTSSTLRQQTITYPSQFQRRYASSDIKNAESELGSGDEAAAVDAAVDSATRSATIAPEAELESAREVESTTVNQAYHPVDPNQGGNVAAGIATPIGAAATPGSFAGNDAKDFRSSGSRAGQPSNQLYVGNLFFDVTESDLEREFSRFGNVRKVLMIYDGRGLSKGFAYVTFDTLESATAAIEGLDTTVFEGRRMTVQYSNSKRDISLDSSARRPLQQTPPGKTLFIGNMAFEMSDADLNDLFKDVKNVIDVRVAIDRRTGQARGFAHADFIDVESAEAARKQLMSKEIYGRNLRVDFSTNFSNRTKRPQP